MNDASMQSEAVDDPTENSHMNNSQPGVTLGNDDDVVEQDENSRTAFQIVDAEKIIESEVSEAYEDDLESEAFAANEDESIGGDKRSSSSDKSSPSDKSSAADKVTSEDNDEYTKLGDESIAEEVLSVCEEMNSCADDESMAELHFDLKVCHIFVSM